jgi:hypothetical protein
MKVLSMVILVEMKQSDASIENTFGLALEDGSPNTSRGAQHANKTKI